jgi:anaerobic selenocysteine-containing dehydrogenase
MRQVIKTLCQMCYFYCGLDVTVEDGKIIRVDGTADHPVNQGRLCAKGIASAQLVSDPNRLKTPLRRVGDRGSGTWKEISWEDALGEMAEKMEAAREQFGPESVGYYRGHAPGWVTNYNYVIRFMNSWGSPNIFTHAHLCFAPRVVAHATTFGPFPEPDYERSQCMMLIGYNPAYTSPVNYAARIIQAKERGAKLIVVDPRFTNTASKADLFLQVRPGSTGALVLAMIQTIIEEGLYEDSFIKQWTTGFDELKSFVKEYTPEKVESITWVASDKIRKAARMVGTIKPAVVVDGNGLDQHTNTVQTVRTTSLLRSIIRSVDEPGGSVFVPPLPFINVQRSGEQAEGFTPEPLIRYPLFFSFRFGFTGVEMTDRFAAPMPYPIKIMIIQGGDPVAVLSESSRTREALGKTDLLVVHDLYRTATAKIADIVLPAASFLERDLILYYRYRPFADANLIAMQKQCVTPVGDSKSDLDFIFGLARRVGLGQYFPWERVTDAFDWELEPNGISTEWLRKHPEGFVRRYKPEELYRKYEKVGFNTPSKKIELVSPRLEEFGSASLPTFVEPLESPYSSPQTARDYPLICSTGLKLGIHTHTQFRTLPWIREIEPEPFGEIHPKTATGLGIRDGDWMKVTSPRGEIKVRARVTPAVHPTVIMITHGFGEPYAGPADLANEITSSGQRDPIAGATGNRSFLCKVTRT